MTIIFRYIIMSIIVIGLRKVSNFYILILINECVDNFVYLIPKLKNNNYLF